ncbi:hypothetical protein ACFQMH_12115, partial [Streptomyces viridiviolaceus]
MRRLAPARVLRDLVDLLLDEPTNHLSPALVEDLEEALHHYQGAPVTVSHDRMAARRVTGRRPRMHAGRLAEWARPSAAPPARRPRRPPVGRAARPSAAPPARRPRRP